MAYCTPADLLLGQLGTRLPPEINAIDYINAAADHIDARLGVTYVTPFITAGVNTLPLHQVKLLKGINAKRASGQIILAATMATEDNALHQYGLWLVREADLELQAVQDGTVRLSAPLVDSEGFPLDPTTDPDDVDPYARIPGAYNIDAYSPNAAFEENVMQGSDAVWSPRDGSRFGPRFPYPRGH
jgi:hypothetical protein